MGSTVAVAARLSWPKGPIILHDRLGGGRIEHVRRRRGRGDEIHPSDDAKFVDQGDGWWLIPAYTSRTVCGVVVWRSPWWGCAEEYCTDLHPRIVEVLLDHDLARWCRKCFDA